MTAMHITVVSFGVVRTMLPRRGTSESTLTSIMPARPVESMTLWVVMYRGRIFTDHESRLAVFRTRAAATQFIIRRRDIPSLRVRELCKINERL
jgi:hypothetical protein